MYETRCMLAERMVNNALDIAAYILERRHNGKPVQVDWIDAPELKELVAKLVILPDDKVSSALGAVFPPTARGQCWIVNGSPAPLSHYCS